MADQKNDFWNGKNLTGESHVGAKSLISEGPRKGATQAKYEVANETVSADNLQPGVTSGTNDNQGG